MLPHFLWADFDEVIGDLQEVRAADRARLVRARTSSSVSPSSATTEASGVTLELRQALEPWHVLGEETAAGGTARYVDNSLDRVQVMVRDGPTAASPSRATAAACR